MIAPSRPDEPQRLECFNFSEAAEQSSAEDLLGLRDRGLAEKYAEALTHPFVRRKVDHTAIAQGDVARGQRLVGPAGAEDIGHGGPEDAALDRHVAHLAGGMVHSALGRAGEGASEG